MNVDMNQKSKYVNMTAEECVKYHMNRSRIPSWIGVGIILVFAFISIYFLITDKNGFPLTELFFVFAIVIFISARKNTSTRFKSLHDIINIDCDPEKYLNVMQLLLEHSKKKQTRSTLYTLLARANNGLRDYNAMKKCLDKIDIKKKVPAQELTILNLSGNYFIRTNQMAQYEECKVKIQKMNQETKLSENAQLFINNVLTLWECTVCIQNEEEKEARRLMEILLPSMKSPYDTVSTRFLMAEIELIAGNMEPAKEHLEFVKTYGNTMAVQKEATRMLEDIE